LLFADNSFIKFLVALSSSKQNPVEMQTGQPQFETNLLFVLLSYIKTIENLAISGWAQLVQDPSHNGGLLGGQYAL
jgi:hypothetical protein